MMELTMAVITIRPAEKSDAMTLSNITWRSKGYWGYDEEFLRDCGELLNIKSSFIEKATLYVGNDTSLINIAAAVGRNCIRIFASNLSVLSSPLIETALPEDPARMDIAGAIDDIDAGRIHRAASAYLYR